MLQFAIETAREAGHLLLEKFGRITAVTKKGDINLVTEADLASEALIIERIKSHHPKHAILAEEAGDAVVVDGTNVWKWIIDPLVGTTNYAHGYPSFAVTLANPMILLAVGLLIVGFGFKVAAVPFHMWSPDAYEGAPAVVTGFMSTGVKAAAIAAFARVFLTALEPMINEWAPVLWVVAAATMIVGTVLGVAQTSLKRMLAYSSIAHGGYLLVGLVAGNAVGKAAILYYLAAYALTNLGAFGIIALLGSRERSNDDLRDYAGLWYSHPALATLMTIFLLSLGGFPPTAGFIAKWYVFSAAVGAGYYGLAIIGVLSSVVSVFFYLRIVVMMYMSERDARPMPAPIGALALAALGVAVVGILYLGILPTQVIDIAQASVATIF
jgi:NADH-quinone oxidoreductase subunit N